MSTYQQERREDRRQEYQARIDAEAARAEQTRKDKEAADERRAARQREEDERNARLAKSRRADKAADRKAKQATRAERRAARREALTPANVYRLGTLALVTASALGSLPAQILHFLHIDAMLLPLPLSIEGAAWVFAAGVAFADARKLPGWVRWLLRVFILAAAGFAANINYGYGKSLPGLSEGEATTAGIGLAAVSLLGPLMFEIRQWVSTLDEKTGSAEDKARRKAEKKAAKEAAAHLKARRNDHKKIAREADRLLSALPLGSITPEEAFATAWEIENGATAGFTAKTFARATHSKVELGAAWELGEHVRPELLRNGLMAAAMNPLGRKLGDRLATLGKTVPVTDRPASDASNVTSMSDKSSQRAAQMPTNFRATKGGTEDGSIKEQRSKPTPPVRRKGDSLPQHPAARAAAAETARRSSVSATVGK